MKFNYLDLLVKTKVKASDIKRGDVVRERYFDMVVKAVKADPNDDGRIELQACLEGMTSYHDPDELLDCVPVSAIDPNKLTTLLEWADAHQALYDEFEPIADPYGNAKERRNYEKYQVKQVSMEEKYRKVLQGYLEE